MADSDPTPRLGNHAPLTLDRETLDLRPSAPRYTDPNGIPVSVVDEVSRRRRRTIPDTGERADAAQAAAEDAAEVAAGADKRMRALESAVASAKRRAAAALVPGLGALLALVAKLLSAARDDGAAAERARIQAEEVRQLRIDVRELQSIVYRLQGRTPAADTKGPTP